MTDGGDEIERLSQALALVEGFQLLVLECHDIDSTGLYEILDVVQARVAELRGVPPLIVVYDPRLTTDAEGSLRDEAWVEGVLGPILELSVAALSRAEPWPSPDAKPRPSPPALPGTSVVAVLDGTTTAFTKDEEIASWTYLFHRINERRNALVREFYGTFALALSPALVRLFLEEAPDAASIRSGIFELRPSALRSITPRAHDLLPWYPAHLVRDAALRRLASDRRLSRAARRDLARDFHHSEVYRYWSRNSNGAYLLRHELLRNLFSSEDLRRFAGTYFDSAVVTGLGGPETDPDELVEEFVDGVTASGVSMRTFFESLARERPQHYPEIARVASQWGYDMLPRSSTIAVPSPSELVALLVQLPRERLEQVVLLADLAQNSRMHESHARSKARTRLPAREIVAQAVTEGPDALRRLAEAIELVASR